ncbi:MAG: DUF3592 domain-containing protein [Planctomycetes bacterium]|nr:DUF3592 domain-containing protein [Planctomycetota bacterium]
MIIVPILFIVVGVLVSLVLAPVVFATMRAKATWSRTMARVESTDDLGDDGHVPHYTFTVAGAVYSGRGSISATSYKRTIGTDIPIVYDPSDPRKNDVSSSFWRHGWLAILALGLIFVAMGICGLYYPNGIVVFGNP